MRRGNHNNQPGAVGHLHTDALALLAPALRGGVIAGTRPTQTGPAVAAAAVVVAARRPAGPGAKASVHGHVSDLSPMETKAL